MCTIAGMGSKRQSSEAGHKRKFLVVVDATPECDRAVVYGAWRAAHTGGGLVLLYVIEDADFKDFIGVEQAMRAEARAEAELTLARVAERARAVAGIDPEQVIAEGTPSAEIPRLIERDTDIAVLVLAAGTGSDGPGPLVSSIAARGSGAFPVPVTIVPGHLSDDDMAALA
jgi:nucleotide-binding universal stress UspA family protein